MALKRRAQASLSPLQTLNTLTPHPPPPPSRRSASTGAWTRSRARRPSQTASSSPTGARRAFGPPRPPIGRRAATLFPRPARTGLHPPAHPPAHTHLHTNPSHPPRHPRRYYIELTGRRRVRIERSWEQDGYRVGEVTHFKGEARRGRRRGSVITTAGSKVCRWAPPAPAARRGGSQRAPPLPAPPDAAPEAGSEQEAELRRVAGEVRGAGWMGGKRGGLAARRCRRAPWARSSPPARPP
jgi:hypothetical protein